MSDRALRLQRRFHLVGAWMSLSMAVAVIWFRRFYIDDDSIDVDQIASVAAAVAAVL
ncbi:MAG: hypothetical protein ACREP7_05525 [Lysobacter sp.]